MPSGLSPCEPPARRPLPDAGRASHPPGKVLRRIGAGASIAAQWLAPRSDSPLLFDLSSPARFFVRGAGDGATGSGRSPGSTRPGAVRWPGRWWQPPSSSTRRRIPDGLDDFKRLSHDEREALFADIMARRVARVGRVGRGARASTAINILQRQPGGHAPGAAALPVLAAAGAGRRARRAARPALRRAQALIKGDQRSQSIAAASIVAKVMRDRMMARCGRGASRYGFEMHMGYATERHRAAIGTHGPMPACIA